MKNFDELFNEFFDEDGPHPASEELRKIMESIAHFKGIKTEDELEASIHEELGEPTSIEEHIKDGLRFKKLIWDTEHGQFIKIVVTDVNNIEEIEEVSLQEQLDEALDEENYELAIKLRDKIKANENNPKSK